jgi:Ricin-type beta-trefoil lectin domain-like
MRGESGGSTGLRGSRAARLTGAGLAVLLAAVGVTAYLVIDGIGKQADAPLPTRVLSTQAIGLVNPGPAGTGTTSSNPSGTGPAALAGSLLASGTGLTFSAAAQSAAEWTADQMAGGTYIFIYLANSGLCLASPASSGPAVMQRCDLAANQRWTRLGPTVGAGGTDYWQLRNLADSRCLTAGSLAGEAAQLEPCQFSPIWTQLVTFAAPS